MMYVYMHVKASHALKMMMTYGYLTHYVEHLVSPVKLPPATHTLHE